MPGRGSGYVTKTHFLKQTNLGSLLEPADPSEADFTATKGTFLNESVAKCCLQYLASGLRVPRHQAHTTISVAS